MIWKDRNKIYKKSRRKAKMISKTNKIKLSAYRNK